MPRAPKRCGRVACPNTAPAGRTYCTAHEAEHQAALAARRGTTAARGYGAEHQRMRASWAPLVSAGQVTCWRCGEPIEPGTPWDLGHDDQDRGITRGPEHAYRCNRRTAGRQGGG